MKPLKFESEPEPNIKMADVCLRNDARFEELLEEFVRNRDEELDKIEETK